MNYIIIYYLHDESVLVTINLKTGLQKERYCQEYQVLLWNLGDGNGQRSTKE